MLLETLLTIFVLLLWALQYRQNAHLQSKIYFLEQQLETLSVTVALDMLDRDNTLDTTVATDGECIELTTKGGDAN